MAEHKHGSEVRQCASRNAAAWQVVLEAADQLAGPINVTNASIGRQSASQRAAIAPRAKFGRQADLRRI
jgi:hypothetical protein